MVRDIVVSHPFDNIVNITCEKERDLVSLFHTNILHTGVLAIREEVRYDEWKEKVDEQKLWEEVKNVYSNMEKNNGEMLVLIKEGADEKFLDKCVSVLKLEKKKDKEIQGIAREYCEMYEPGMLTWKSFRSTVPFVHTKNETQIMKDVEMIEKTKEAVKMCIEKGYILHGKWDIRNFKYMFHQKYDRMMTIQTEANKYFLDIEEEKIDITNDDIQDICEKIMMQLQKQMTVGKVERLERLFKEEVSIFFVETMRKMQNNSSEENEKIWNVIRSYYTYEEIEKECCHVLNGMNRMRFDKKDDILFIKFKEHYVAYQKESFSFISPTKEELLERIAEHQKKRWGKTMESW